MFRPRIRRSNEFRQVTRTPRRWPRLRLDRLEDRTVPATIAWDGGLTGQGTNWLDSINWVGDVVPGPTDQAVIGAAGTAQPGEITLAGNTSVRSAAVFRTLRCTSGALTIGATGSTFADLVLDGGTLSPSDGAFVFSSTIHGPGTLTNPAGRTLTVINTDVYAPLVNNGTLVAYGYDNFNGGLTAPAGSMLRVQYSGGGSGTTLSVEGDFTNRGTIELAGANGVGLDFGVNGRLTNLGTVTVTGAGGSFNLYATTDNRGTITVGADTLLYLGANGGDVSTNAGTIAVAAGGLLAASGFRYESGSVTGAGSVELRESATLAANYTVGVSRFSLADCTFDGPGTLTNPAGHTLILSNSTVNAPLVNQGTLVTTPFPATVTNTINGPFSNAAGATLRVNASTLSIRDGFTNGGATELSNIPDPSDPGTSAWPATLSVGGVLVNAAGGSITTLAGAGGARTLAGRIDNRGTITVGADTTWTGSDNSVNSGTVNVTGGNLTALAGVQGVSVPIGGLANADIRTYGSEAYQYPAAPTVLTVGGVPFNLVPLGSVANSLGAIQAPPSEPYQPPATSVYTISANVANPTVVYTLMNSKWGNFGADIATLEFVGAHGARATFELIEGTNIRDHFNYLSNNIIAPGTPSASFGPNLRLDRQTFVLPSSFASDTLTQIIFTAHGGYPQGSAFLAAVTVGTASLSLVNSGTVNIAGFTFQGSMTNTGTIAVAAGGLLAVSGFRYESGSITGAGSVELSGSATFAADYTVGVGGFSLKGCALDGPGTLTNPAGRTLTLEGSTVGAPLINRGTVQVVGDNQVNGSLSNVTGATIRVQGTLRANSSVVNAAGSTIRIEANAPGTEAALVVPGGFTNAGAIELTGVGNNAPSSGARLEAVSGPIINAQGASITALAGAGGARTLAGRIDNRGTLTIGTDTTWAGSDNSVNSGTVNVTGGNLTAPAGAQGVPVPIGVLANTNIRTYSGGTSYPVAPLTLTVGGVAFNLVPSDLVPNSLGVIQAPSGTSVFMIPTNIVGPSVVYTLMNSAFGVLGADIATIEFVGARGARASFELIEGTNIRDHFNDGYNNVIAVNTPSASFGTPGLYSNVRLDRQTFVLPSSFAGDTLTQIIFTGHGGIPQGNAFLAAVSVGTASVSLVNSGIVNIGGFTFQGSVTNTGTITIAEGGTLAGSLTNTGTLAGAGTVAGAITGAGTVSPGGTAPGRLTVNGDLGGAGLAVDLNGTAAGTQYDQLRVNGAVTLGGPLTVSVGFAAPVGSTFVIVDNDGTDPVTGTFAGLSERTVLTVGGQTFWLSYMGGTGNDVTLTRGLPPPPQVRSVRVDAGTAQRSRVTSLTVTFDTAVTFAGAVAAAFALTRDSDGTAVAFTATTSATSGVTVVTLSQFAGAATEAGSLANGRYTLTVRASQVSTIFGSLDGNGDGTPGDDYRFGATQGLVRLYGDATGDGWVDAADLTLFRQAFGSMTGDPQYLNWPDVNGDGAINGIDLTRFRQVYFASPPRVSAVQVNDGSAQRSRISSLSVTFSTFVTFAGAPAAAFDLTREDGTPVTFAATVSQTGAGTRVTLDHFAGPAVEAGSLADGRYTLKVLASQVSTPGGPLDGNADGAPGDDYTFAAVQGLIRMYGDANGDGKVDAADLALFRQTFGRVAGDPKYLSGFDVNGDGAINGTDLTRFRQAFGGG